MFIADHKSNISQSSRSQMQQMVSLGRKRRLSSHENPGSARTKITRVLIPSSRALGVSALSKQLEPSICPKESLNGRRDISGIIIPPFQAKNLQKTPVPDNAQLRELAKPAVADLSTTESRYNSPNKRSSQITINFTPRRYKVEYKGSAGLGDYQEFPVKENNDINSHLSKGRKSFWLKSESSGCYYLYDVETMQQHNINTGYRRSIRFSEPEPEPVIDLTVEPGDLIRAGSNDSIDSVCQIPVVTSNVGNFLQRSSAKRQEDHDMQEQLQQHQRHHQTIDYCGQAFAGAWLCGAITNRKLLEIRRLQLQGSWLMNEMRGLPTHEQLFDPEPISPSDSRFPMEQIKYLGCGGLTVHEVRQTRMWKRSRSHFDLLLKEEKDYFSIYKKGDTPLHLVHFGWHGAPAESIKGILECGFLSVPTARVGRCYGHGIYLATKKYATYSKRDRFSVPDAAGFKYLLLCEVLPGTVEVSKSGQTHPSSNLTHSGVDRMPKPMMHVFFTHDMNVRISPKFVVCILPPVTEHILSRVQQE